MQVGLVKLNLHVREQGGETHACSCTQRIRKLGQQVSAAETMPRIGRLSSRAPVTASQRQVVTPAKAFEPRIAIFSLWGHLWALFCPV